MPGMKPREKKKAEARIRARIRAWLDAPREAGDPPHLTFGVELSKQERHIVHHVAAALDLFHYSLGDGDARCICVSRAPDLVPTGPRYVREGKMQRRLGIGGAGSRSRRRADNSRAAALALRAAPDAHPSAEQVEALIRLDTEAVVERLWAQVDVEARGVDGMDRVPCTMVDTAEGLEALAQVLDGGGVTEVAVDLEVSGLVQRWLGCGSWCMGMGVAGNGCLDCVCVCVCVCAMWWKGVRGGTWYVCAMEVASKVARAR